MKGCPSKRTLVELAMNEAPLDVVRHVGDCDACSVRYARLRTDLSMVKSVLTSTASPRAVPVTRRPVRQVALGGAVAALAAGIIAWLTLSLHVTPGEPPESHAEMYLRVVSATMFGSSDATTSIGWGASTVATSAVDGCEWGLLVRCSDTLSARLLGDDIPAGGR